jgi:hypothetical protein
MFKGVVQTEKMELICIDFDVFQVNFKGPWPLSSKNPGSAFLMWRAPKKSKSRRICWEFNGFLRSNLEEELSNFPQQHSNLCPTDVSVALTRSFMVAKRDRKMTRKSLISTARYY